MFKSISPRKQKAFTLVELLTVMVVLVALATITVKSTAQFSFDSRYQITEDRYDKIKTAILGNPNQTINGHPSVSGFVADMGRLPSCIRELIDGWDCEHNLSDSQYKIDLRHYCSDSAYLTKTDCQTATKTWITGYCVDSNGVEDTTKITKSTCETALKTWIPYYQTGLGYGWRGGYISISSDPLKNNAFTDGWGRLPIGYCANSKFSEPADCTGTFKGYCRNPIYADYASCSTNSEIWSDYNYGWYFNQLTTDNLTIMSYGKNQIYDNSTPLEQYDTDFPETNAPSSINVDDWLVTLPNTIISTAVKPISSTEADSLKVLFTTQRTCESAGGTWNTNCEMTNTYICFVFRYRGLTGLEYKASTRQQIPNDGGLPRSFSFILPSVTPVAIGQIAYSVNIYDNNTTTPVDSKCTDITYPILSNPPLNERFPKRLSIVPRNNLLLNFDW